MTRLEAIRQSALKNKAAALLNKKISQVKKVDEHHNGATVYMKSGSSAWVNIPLEIWIGQSFE